MPGSRSRPTPARRSSALLPLLEGYRVDRSYVEKYTELNAAWEETVEQGLPARDSQCGS